ncbi:uncharacterized protein MAM_02601 [Metarhizium album ARSEF 1941]|uniref:GPI anchored serine-threonine rich protein n=1 Tax=Metarhizium album (strain ARSEF 1941) TaxID=1081103 RepID=A0A0B2X0F8_METAS|nr:uncharacterized protein MAM_02601 [Metarhizium album ARSEF 1941]KHN99748.1 hypothetical protein MAM_02601 [Metarhizium album ARSEF 1941]
MKKLAVVAFVSGSLAAFFEASGLSARDSAAVACSDVGRKTCGAVCIEPSDTCCPDGSGGCPAGSVCWLGDNDRYGCCVAGETCEGPGGSDITTVAAPGATDASAGETGAAEATESPPAAGSGSGSGSVGTATAAPKATANATANASVTRAAPTALSPSVTAGAAANGLAGSGLLGVVLVVLSALV